MTDVELIKSKLDIVNFIGEFITLKKSGRNYKALCPFHGEKTPSFYVSPERGSWHCFGCNEGGDAITFLQKWEGIEFLEALKILAERTGVTLSGFVKTESFAQKEKIYGINNLASEYYHYLLLSHKVGKHALEYLQTRHIKPETIKTFAIGYSPNSWDSLIKFLLKKGYSEEDMLLAGLVGQSERGRVYDRFRGRLIFTLKDSRGNTIGFSGRILPPGNEKDLPAGQAGAKYINSPETPVYIKGNTLYGMDVTKDAIKKEKFAVVVEGEIDMISSFQSGVGNVVAIKGSAFTEEQVILLKRFVDEVVLALDADFAGNEAARRGIEIAERGGLLVKVAKLPVGKDPAECIEKGAHFWKEAVKNAIPIYDFIIDTALKKYNPKEISGKKNIGNEVLPFLSKITNSIILSHYIRSLAKSLDVSESAIEQQLLEQRKKIKTGITDMPTPPVVKENWEEQLEEYLLTLIIQSKDPNKTIEKVTGVISISSDLKLPSVAKILTRLDDLKDTSPFNVKTFASQLPPELVSVFDRAYLTDISSVLGRKDKKDAFENELTRVIFQVKRTHLRRKLETITTDIRQAETEGNESKLLQLNEEVKKLTIELHKLEK